MKVEYVAFAAKTLERKWIPREDIDLNLFYIFFGGDGDVRRLRIERLYLG